MVTTTGYLNGEYRPTPTVKRPFYGVVLQGVGFNRGEGFIQDATTIQRMDLTPLP